MFENTMTYNTRSNKTLIILTFILLLSLLLCFRTCRVPGEDEIIPHQKVKKDAATLLHISWEEKPFIVPRLPSEHNRNVVQLELEKKDFPFFTHQLRELPIPQELSSTSGRVYTKISSSSFQSPSASFRKNNRLASTHTTSHQPLVRIATNAHPPAYQQTFHGGKKPSLQTQVPSRHQQPTYVTQSILAKQPGVKAHMSPYSQKKKGGGKKKERTNKKNRPFPEILPIPLEMKAAAEGAKKRDHRDPPPPGGSAAAILSSTFSSGGLHHPVSHQSTPKRHSTVGKSTQKTSKRTSDAPGLTSHPGTLVNEQVIPETENQLLKSIVMVNPTNEILILNNDKIGPAKIEPAIIGNTSVSSHFEPLDSIFSAPLAHTEDSPLLADMKTTPGKGTGGVSDLPDTHPPYIKLTGMKKLPLPEKISLDPVPPTKEPSLLAKEGSTTFSETTGTLSELPDDHFPFVEPSKLKDLVDLVKNPLDPVPHTEEPSLLAKEGSTTFNETTGTLSGLPDDHFPFLEPSKLKDLMDLVKNPLDPLPHTEEPSLLAKEGSITLINGTGTATETPDSQPTFIDSSGMKNPLTLDKTPPDPLLSAEKPMQGEEGNLALNKATATSTNTPNNQPTFIGSGGLKNPLTIDNTLPTLPLTEESPLLAKEGNVTLNNETGAVTETPDSQPTFIGSGGLKNPLTIDKTLPTLPLTEESPLLAKEGNVTLNNSTGTITKTPDNQPTFIGSGEMKNPLTIDKTLPTLPLTEESPLLAKEGNVTLNNGTGTVTETPDNHPTFIGSGGMKNPLALDKTFPTLPLTEESPLLAKEGNVTLNNSTGTITKTPDNQPTFIDSSGMKNPLTLDITSPNPSLSAENPMKSEEGNLVLNKGTATATNVPDSQLAFIGSSGVKNPLTLDKPIGTDAGKEVTIGHVDEETHGNELIPYIGREVSSLIQFPSSSLAALRTILIPPMALNPLALEGALGALRNLLINEPNLTLPYELHMGRGVLALVINREEPQRGTSRDDLLPTRNSLGTLSLTNVLNALKHAFQTGKRIHLTLGENGATLDIVDQPLRAIGYHTSQKTSPVVIEEVNETNLQLQKPEFSLSHFMEVAQAVDEALKGLTPQLETSWEALRIAGLNVVNALQKLVDKGSEITRENSEDTMLIHKINAIVKNIEDKVKNTFEQVKVQSKFQADTIRLALQKGKQSVASLREFFENEKIEDVTLRTSLAFAKPNTPESNKIDDGPSPLPSLKLTDSQAESLNLILLKLDPKNDLENKIDDTATHSVINPGELQISTTEEEKRSNHDIRFKKEFDPLNPRDIEFLAQNITSGLKQKEALSNRPYHTVHAPQGISFQEVLNKKKSINTKRSILDYKFAQGLKTDDKELLSRVASTTPSFWYKSKTETLGRCRSRRLPRSGSWKNEHGIEGIEVSNY